MALSSDRGSTPLASICNMQKSDLSRCALKKMLAAKASIFFNKLTANICFNVSEVLLKKVPVWTFFGYIRRAFYRMRMVKLSYRAKGQFNAVMHSPPFVECIFQRTNAWRVKERNEASKLQNPISGVYCLEQN